MRIVQQTVYTFDELPDHAKSKAIESYRDGMEYFWGDEWRDSLDAFCKEFGLDVRNWRVDSWNYDFSLSIPDNADMKGARLFKYLQNNHDVKKLLSGDCPFTGYCGDECFLDPLREFMARPSEETTWEELARDCLHSGFMGGKDDFASQETDEYISDHIQANGYEYDENGNPA
jgi:hypothetical protein